MKSKMKKIFVVTFDTESGDHYVAAFKDKPTDRHLSAYIKENNPEEIDDENNCRTIFWDITEVPIQELPKPIKAIPSI